MFVGTVGIIDPPREEAAAAIREARRAGIRVIMITGDHPRTAARIAADLGIGDTAREIALLAEETRSELLVLGTRGRGAAHHALIGSIALKAAAASSVPVLLVK